MAFKCIDSLLIWIGEKNPTTIRINYNGKIGQKFQRELQLVQKKYNSRRYKRNKTELQYRSQERTMSEKT